MLLSEIICTSVTSTATTVQISLPELVPLSSPSPRREATSQTPPPALLSPSLSPKCDFRRTPGKGMQGADEDLTGVSIALSVLNSIAQSSTPEPVKKTLPLPPLLSPERFAPVKAVELPELIAADEDQESDFDADLLALPDLLSLTPQPIPTPELIPLSPEEIGSRYQGRTSSPWSSKPFANILSMLG
eukprot:TRINITY_DN1515_c1_g2_i1.p1 TRINITY_DN1515_c1_g2~~TRINITY_DN1515_c1_g2_i1.p1  ORF type:complete len:188 (+),score=33.55 TRINITY_DN1515_c1_g2_i1:288-851(+)